MLETAKLVVTEFMKFRAASEVRIPAVPGLRLSAGKGILEQVRTDFATSEWRCHLHISDGSASSAHSRFPASYFHMKVLP
jgi:hypothetical protein